MEEFEMGETVRGFTSGQLIGSRFRLETILGRGGMGVVWRAKDEELDRTVALKFLPEAVAMDARNIVEMKRETRRALELTHPHIVRIYDFVQADGAIAISMEYISGDSLSERMGKCEGGAFSVDEQLKRWTSQLCDGLVYAHERAKIVHRDLKPANLMTDEHGDLRIADFGISASVTESVSRVSVSSLTSGTPLYMSPQQMMGERPTPADDIYALGATLYELLTGRPPFYMGNIILQAQQKQPAPLAQRRTELNTTGEPIPPEWESTILHCLAKKPEDRPGSMMEIAEMLGLGRSNTGSFLRVSSPGVSAGSVKPMNPGGATGAGTSVGDSANLETSKETASSAAEPTKSKTPIILGLVAFLALGGAGGWWAYQNYGSTPLEPQTESVSAAVAPPAAAIEVVADEPAVEATSLQMLNSGANSPAEGTLGLTLPGGIELSFLEVSPGTFRQGSPVGELGRRNDERLRDASVDEAFWLGATEVTQEQYVAIMGTNPSRNRFSGPTHPVEQVTWSDLTGPEGFLVKFNRWLADSGQQEWQAVLPSEVEWEYACRAGTESALSNGSNLTNAVRDNQAGELAIYGTVSSAAVGTKTPNSWGFYDMHGNVAEWTADGVLRGGAFRDNAEFVRSASRLRGYQNHRQPDPRFGFRLALKAR